MLSNQSWSNVSRGETIFTLRFSGSDSVNLLLNYKLVQNLAA